jgi:hypothetical protein
LRGLRFTHASAIAIVVAFILLAADRAGHLRKAPVWTSPPKSPPRAVEAAKPHGKPPPHHDKVEDMPEGKGREVTFYTCTACHGVALIKAQGLTRELWDHTFDTMLEKHRMPPVKPAERAEILDYLAEQFPPRRRARSGDNPFLK